MGKLLQLKNNIAFRIECAKWFWSQRDEEWQCYSSRYEHGDFAHFFVVLTILFGFESEDVQYEEAVAYKNLGTYMTDYGEGREFEYLSVFGFKWCVGLDGTM